jgi:hypothetical protein
MQYENCHGQCLSEEKKVRTGQSGSTGASDGTNEMAYKAKKRGLALDLSIWSDPPVLGTRRVYFYFLYFCRTHLF